MSSLAIARHEPPTRKSRGAGPGTALRSALTSLLMVLASACRRRAGRRASAARAARWRSRRSRPRSDARAPSRRRPCRRRAPRRAASRAARPWPPAAPPRRRSRHGAAARSRAGPGRRTPARPSASRTAAVATAMMPDSSIRRASAANRRSAAIARCPAVGAEPAGLGEPGAEAAEHLLVVEIRRAARHAVEDHEPHRVRPDVDHPDALQPRLGGFLDRKPGKLARALDFVQRPRPASVAFGRNLASSHWPRQPPSARRAVRSGPAAIAARRQCERHDRPSAPQDDHADGAFLRGRPPGARSSGRAVTRQITSPTSSATSSEPSGASVTPTGRP